MLNLMQTGGDPLKLTEFKEESIALRVLGFLLVSGNRMWKPWEWDAKEHKNMPNPSKILGHLWDKEDTRVFCKSFPWKSSCDQTNYSKLLWSRIWSTWNWQKENMSIDKPVMRRGHWNAVFSRHLGDHVAYLHWARRIRTVQMPRRGDTSVIGEMHAAGVHLYLFGDASNFACCAVTVAVTWNMTRV